jgi:predicted ester cyclase
MSEQENIRIVKMAFDRLNDHKLEPDNQITSPNLRVQTVDSPTELNLKDYHSYLSRIVDAFPDLHFTIRDIIAQGDKVTALWTVKGTQKAAYTPTTGMTIPATNKPVNLPGCSYYEFKNNVVSRQEIFFDRAGLLTQLGVMNEQEMMARSKH